MFSEFKPYFDMFVQFFYNTNLNNLCTFKIDFQGVFFTNVFANVFSHSEMLRKSCGRCKSNRMHIQFIIFFFNTCCNNL